MKHKKIITILSVETSCDETAAAVLTVDLTKGNGIKIPAIETKSSVVKSQIAIHKFSGGVIPEVAARAHVKNILPVVQKALRDAKKELADIDYIAPTVGPGLIPSLIIGTEFTKALSLATGIPIVPVNHMAGHLYSPFGKGFSSENFQFPMIALIVSGGHTLLVLMKNLKTYEILGQTVDDAAGEAFDKVAKLLKLPYPGGPEVSKLAEQGKPSFEFPRPMIHSKDYNFSFSGLKTAVLYHVQSTPQSEIINQKSSICKAFQDAVIDVLVTKTLRAAKEYTAKSISLSGGVSANTALRTAFTQQSKILNLQFLVPGKGLSTDNAEMIGIAAAIQLWHGKKPIPAAKVTADPNLQL